MEKQDMQKQSFEIIKILGKEAQTLLAKSFEKIEDATRAEAHAPKGDTRREQTLYSVGFAHITLMAIAHDLGIDLEKCSKGFLSDPPYDFFETVFGERIARLPSKAKKYIEESKPNVSENDVMGVYEMPDDMFDEDLKDFGYIGEETKSNTAEKVASHGIPESLEKKALDIICRVKKAKKSKKHASERLFSSLGKYDWEMFVEKNWQNIKGNAAELKKQDNEIKIDKTKLEKGAGGKSLQDEILTFVKKMKSQKKGVKFIKELAIKKYGKDVERFF